jgi:hypothetical protein
MLLPNFEIAIIDVDKLVGYCLNSEHFVGKHKARVFKSALGITADTYFVLEFAIRDAISQYDAIFTNESNYGKQYIVDFPIDYNNKYANIRTSWIIKKNEIMPRVTSCYVL